ncbi:hypothetical protein NE237_021544 [Protea cynaroides]|uniref:U1-type domain-containing protein n=1 Tax=Protea cynaroides TaxID=273540 RepID=A0A9Q0H9A0_9MAGN|nr:hypothetical protein NE237_021544 [Protea cynaroides]
MREQQSFHHVAVAVVEEGAMLTVFHFRFRPRSFPISSKKIGIASSLAKEKVSSTVQFSENPTVPDPTLLEHPSSSAEPTKKIMSIELAMKRELAYRRKIELLSLKTPSNSRQAPLPSQMPLPSQTPANSVQATMLPKTPTNSVQATRLPKHPSLVGEKRKEPSSNQGCLPPRQQKPSYTLQRLRKKSLNLICEVCQVPCSGLFNLKQHLKGSKHKAKLQELEDCQNSGTEPLWCELCEVPCMNWECWQQHLTGKKHLAHLQAIEDAKQMREEAEALKSKLKNIQWEMIG